MVVQITLLLVLVWSQKEKKKQHNLYYACVSPMDLSFLVTM